MNKDQDSGSVPSRHKPHKSHFQIVRVEFSGVVSAFVTPEDLTEIQKALNSQKEFWIEAAPIPWQNLKISQSFADQDDSSNPFIHQLSVIDWDSEVEVPVCELRKRHPEDTYELFKNSNLDDVADTTEDYDHVDLAIFWQRHSDDYKKTLNRFSNALSNPSTFPVIEEFEPSALLDRCKVAQSVYEFWKSDPSEESESDNHTRKQHRLTYYMLRYPQLKDLFRLLANSKEDHTNP